MALFRAGGGGVDNTDSYTVRTVNAGVQTRMQGSCAGMFSLNTTLNLDVIVGNNVVNCYQMLYGASNFNSNIIFSGNNVKYLQYMLYNCANFNRSLQIPISVRDCTSMLGLCRLYNEPFSIGNNIISTRGMFYGCISLNSSIDFNNATNLKDCSTMFSGCSNFNKPVEIPDNVNNVSYMLNGCISFNSAVHFSNENFSGSCAYMFHNCTSYGGGQLLFGTSSRIPDTVNNCSYMFANCPNFRDYIYMNPNTNAPMNAYQMYYNCTNYNQPTSLRGNAERALQRTSSFNSTLRLSNITSCQYILLNSNPDFYNDIQIRGDGVGIIKSCYSAFNDRNIRDFTIFNNTSCENFYSTFFNSHMNTFVLGVPSSSQVSGDATAINVWNNAIRNVFDNTTNAMYMFYNGIIDNFYVFNTSTYQRLRPYHAAFFITNNTDCRYMFANCRVTDDVSDTTLSVHLLNDSSNIYGMFRDRNSFGYSCLHYNTENEQKAWSAVGVSTPPTWDFNGNSWNGQATVWERTNYLYKFSWQKHYN